MGEGVDGETVGQSGAEGAADEGGVEVSRSTALTRCLSCREMAEGSHVEGEGREPDTLGKGSE